MLSDCVPCLFEFVVRGGGGVLGSKLTVNHTTLFSSRLKTCRNRCYACLLTRLAVTPGPCVRSVGETCLLMLVTLNTTSLVLHRLQRRAF